MVQFIYLLLLLLMHLALFLKIIAKFNAMKLSAMFFKSFGVLALTFISLIHFEVIFVYGVW